MNKKTLDDYYEKYEDQDLTFNLDVISSVGLLPKQMSFKCRTKSFPCILYSASMKGANILATLDDVFFENLNVAGKKVALRFYFFPPGDKKELSFFINSRVTSFKLYSTTKRNLYFLNIEYLNKPPDALIEILGNYFEISVHQEQRIQERMVINDELESQLGIRKMETFLFIEGNGKKCTLDELSILSAKVIINGKAETFMNHRVMLLMKIEGLSGMGEMVGQVTEAEEISDEEGLVSLIVFFDQENIPPSYKMWIGECMSMIAQKGLPQ